MTEIFHITHLDNLPGILESGCLWSDSERTRRNLGSTIIGHRHIKERRMRRPVGVAAGGMLGDYVPFYFCPRSVMLHSIWRGLVEGYSEGQESVVHLVSTVDEAARCGRPWAFTNLHAELWEADYFEDLESLDRLRWEIISSNSWGGDERRKYKQAEFLVHGRFPWTAVHKVGVCSDKIKLKLDEAASVCAHRPVVAVEPSWYY